MNMTYGDSVAVATTAPEQLRPGAKGSICGVILPADRRGAHVDQFPEGTIYLVEFEDGEAIEIHEGWLLPLSE